jgi:hypothetical protein
MQDPEWLHRLLLSLFGKTHWFLEQMFEFSQAYDVWSRNLNILVSHGLPLMRCYIENQSFQGYLWIFRDLLFQFLYFKNERTRDK